jgi:hypothetical protein
LHEIVKNSGGCDGNKAADQACNNKYAHQVFSRFSQQSNLLADFRFHLADKNRMSSLRRREPESEHDRE